MEEAMMKVAQHNGATFWLRQLDGVDGFEAARARAAWRYVSDAVQCLPHVFARGDWEEAERLLVVILMRRQNAVHFSREALGVKTTTVVWTNA